MVLNIYESHDLKGESAYAKSKIMAESLLLKWGKENGITIGILRLPLIAGPNAPGNLGVMIRSFKAGFFPKITPGSNRKSMVYGPDIARIIPRLFQQGGIYHLTDGYHPSLNELGESLANALGTRPRIQISEGMAKNMASLGDLLGPRFPLNSDKFSKLTNTLTFNDDKARRDLGYNSTRVVDVMGEIVK